MAGTQGQSHGEKPGVLILRTELQPFGNIICLQSCAYTEVSWLQKGFASLLNCLGGSGRKSERRYNRFPFEVKELKSPSALTEDLIL